ncbi:MAG: chemotaxis-specific protein-glutamate methyltransferase CheB [Chlamydiales bacterium]|nr:chemotaxis-specific protein-glutamate methyltransferase CheB [Chlamydiia bacterium]MCP5508336.1 chemotaxis-specific protein-glutamate methyltransferase CheB [Chlamydiales bacterium]
MRIGIVNDVRMAVEILRRLIVKDKKNEVAWVAYNGEEAIKRCQEDTPDLILMDLVMPVMNGVEATRIIMKNTPCAILIVTASVEGNLNMVFNAMGHGALDVVRTPSLDANCGGEDGELLLKKVKNIGVIVAGAKAKVGDSESTDDIRNVKASEVPRLLAIGASTGGPNALAKIVSQFPADVPFATVIIQHVDEEFAPGFAQWISSQTKVPVALAKHGARIREGVIYIAEKNAHLIVTKNGCFQYYCSQENISYCPSVDVFFNSIAENWPSIGIGALLTGMGSDGAQGLKALKEKNWYTIAEHENSCVVYGMPKVAVNIDAVCAILEVEEIAGAILSKMGKKKLLVGDSCK